LLGTKLGERAHNFFNDILEPLFYEALAVERQADYYSPFKCKIPFLNGGLFDPLNDYDWVHTDILIPDELFSNKKKTKQGDIGTGILDVFDRYNFTVKEDEPLEKEVAVDPEMLGKVFENLLEVKDRKSKGTYYTPREIVHYMCQESLINYLATELKNQVKREDIETLIKHGETALENDALVSGQGEEKGRYKYKLPKSVRESNELIDQKLADIKVCDPAVGSGAFLVGMMSEIVRTRSVLARLNDPNEEPNIYDFKRDAIQDSLHGVDIDLGAVEIAKLRLWLSLIVDEEDYKHIKPLPNLDYKIMQGNSLLEEYEGIKLIDERFFKKHEEKELVKKRLKDQQSKLQREYFDLHSNNKLTSTKKTEIEKNLKKIEKQLKVLEQPKTNGQDPFDIFGQTEARSKAEKLLELHERFFNVYHKSEKESIHKQINELTWSLIETTLKQKGKEDKLEDVKRFQRTNTSPFFLWQLNFAEVFRTKQGFDVVIANPPYVVLQEDRKDQSTYEYIKKKYSVASYKIDLYHLFIELGVRRLSPTGTLCFITPSNFTTNNYAIKLRRFLTDIAGIYKLLFFDEGVFDASVDNAVFFAQQSRLDENIFTCHKAALKYGLKIELLGTLDKERLYNDKHALFVPSMSDEVVELIDKIDSKSKPLGEIAYVNFGMQLRNRKEYPNDVLDIAKGGRKTKWHRQCYAGKDVHEYYVEYNGKYCYFNRDAKMGGCWDEDKHSTKKKILIRQVGSYPIAGIDYKGYAVLNAAFMIIIKSNIVSPEYLLALLNSKLMRFVWVNKYADRRKDFPKIKGDYLKLLPILTNIDDTSENMIEKAVTKVISYSKADKHQLATASRKTIDKTIYRAYGLTPEEIAIIEGRA